MSKFSKRSFETDDDRRWWKFVASVKMLTSRIENHNCRLYPSEEDPRHDFVDEYKVVRIHLIHVEV